MKWLGRMSHGNEGMVTWSEREDLHDFHVEWMKQSCHQQVEKRRSTDWCTVMRVF